MAFTCDPIFFPYFILSPARFVRLSLVHLLSLSALVLISYGAFSTCHWSQRFLLPSGLYPEFWFLPPGLSASDHDSVTENYDFADVEVNFGFLANVYMVTLVLCDSFTIQDENVQVKVWEAHLTF